jgi:hypothetical protein
MISALIFTFGKFHLAVSSPSLEALRSSVGSYTLTKQHALLHSFICCQLIHFIGYVSIIVKMVVFM